MGDLIYQTMKIRKKGKFKNIDSDEDDDGKRAKVSDGEKNHRAQGHTMPTMDMAKLFASRGLKATILTTSYYAQNFSKTIEKSRAFLGTQVKVLTIKIPCSDVGLPEGIESVQMLGANAILAVSLALCKAGAHVAKTPLYQEFMILSVGASSFKEAMKMGVEVYHNLKSVIKKKYGQDATNVGDEGGFAPNIQENKEGLELLKTAIAKVGYTGKVVIGMDVAASEFYGSDKTYDLNFKEENNNGSEKISGDALKDPYKSFVSEYPIVSIEDPFDQDDWEHYAKMTAECGEQVQIVGDDLLVTNPKRVEKAIKENSCNALLLKVNQIGSLTESIEAVRMSKKAGWGVMASHRSGETEDTFIADLSVGLATLLRIEEELGSKAVYAGAKFRVPVEPY
ncbi:hypothetical protein CsatB_022783 [Cannabis sativa]